MLGTAVKRMPACSVVVPTKMPAARSVSSPPGRAKCRSSSSPALRCAPSAPSPGCILMPALPSLQLVRLNQGPGFIAATHDLRRHVERAQDTPGLSPENERRSRAKSNNVCSASVVFPFSITIQLPRPNPGFGSGSSGSVPPIVLDSIGTRAQGLNTRESPESLAGLPYVVKGWRAGPRNRACGLRSPGC